MPWTADAPGRRTWLVSSSRGPTRVGPLHLAAAEEQATWTAGARWQEESRASWAVDAP